MLSLVEQEGQVDQSERLQPCTANEGRGVGHGHLERAALQRGNHGHVVAERAAGEQLHFDLAAAFLVYELAEFLDRLRLGMVVVEADADFDRALADVLRLGGRRCQQAGEQDRSKGLELHDFLLVGPVGLQSPFPPIT